MMNPDSVGRLLEHLSDGDIHSGESLGGALGISRAAVWKQVRAAQLAGVPLSAIRGEGYRLQAGFELLNTGKIQQYCRPDIWAMLSGTEIALTLDSTNLQMTRRFQEGLIDPWLILAEKQTAGRGRRGRPWHGSFGSGIYMTLGWSYADGMAVLEGLSLVIGLKVLEVLTHLGVGGLKLKWPNDIYWGQRKLAGILIDVQGDPAGLCQVAIGIGINTNLQEVQGTLIDQPWVDLITVMNGRSVSRNQLVAQLLNQLIPVLDTLPAKGFAAYRESWQSHDLCYGYPVRVQSGQSVVAGLACGVNSQGAYGIEVRGNNDHSQPVVQYINGGEISLRLDLCETSE